MNIPCREEYRRNARESSSPESDSREKRRGFRTGEKPPNNSSPLLLLRSWSSWIVEFEIITAESQSIITATYTWRFRRDRRAMNHNGNGGLNWTSGFSVAPTHGRAGMGWDGLGDSLCIWRIFCPSKLGPSGPSWVWRLVNVAGNWNCIPGFDKYAGTPLPPTIRASAMGIINNQ